MNKVGSKIAVYIIWGLILMLSLTLVKNISRAGRIRGQIEAEKRKLVKIQADNDKLATELANAQSPSFIEKEVRDKLGLGKTGEAMVVLPDEEILKKLAPTIPVESEVLPDPNWKKWVNLFISN